MKNYNAKTYLNPMETNVIARLSYEKASIITRNQLNQWFRFSPKAMDKTVLRLSRKGILRPINKGIYFYSPLETGPSGININEFLVPSLLFPKGNYYVGYSTMYNYYGFFYQIPQVMHLLNTTVQRQKYIGNMLYKLLRVPSSRIFGIEEISIKGRKVIVSDKERTLVDMVYFPDPVGGLKKAFEILKDQMSKINVGRLIKYAVLFPNISTRKRIGFILQKAGVPGKALLPLIRSISRTSLSTLYNARSRKGVIIKKWRLIENDPQKS